MSSLPARILDDLMICRTRAYYTAHPKQFKPRRIPDMEDSEKRGRIFVREYLIPKLEELLEGETIHTVMKIEDCNTLNKRYYIVYEGLDKEIACKPDAVLIVLFNNRFLRTLVLEIADTNTTIIMRKKHVIPRLLLYLMATYLYYGVPSVGIYVSLSPSSNPPTLLFLPKSGVKGTLIKHLERVKEITELDTIPSPSKRPICSHCIYAPICKFRV